MLLASLLEIISNINGCSIILNLTQSFNISTKIRECLGNIIVKNIKDILPLKPRLLKPKVSNKNSLGNVVIKNIKGTPLLKPKLLKL